MFTNDLINWLIQKHQQLLTKSPQDEPLRTEYSPYAAYGYPDLVNPYAHHAMSRWDLKGQILDGFQERKLGHKDKVDTKFGLICDMWSRDKGLEICDLDV